MKKKAVLSIFFLMISLVLISGKTVNERIKDLEKKLPTVSGKEKVDVLINLARNLAGRSLKKSIQYGTQALELAQTLKYQKGEISALKQICNGYIFAGNYKKAIEHLQRLLKFTEILNEKDQFANTLRVIGIAYFYATQYENALDYYFKSLKVSEEINDKKGMNDTINNIALIYFELKEWDKALEYHKKSLKIEIELENQKGIAESHDNLGNTYCAKGQIDLALEYYLKAKETFEKMGDKRELTGNYINLSRLYHQSKKDFKKAIFYSSKALEMSQQIGWKDSESRAAINLGETYLKQKKYNQALKYFNQSLSIAKEIKSKELIKNSLLNLANVNSEMGDYKQAFEFHKLYSDIKDEIFNDQSSKQIAEMRTKYETETKEKENEILKKNNELLQRDNKIQRMSRNALISGLVLVIIILILLFKKYLYLFAFWKKKTYISHYKITDKIASGGMATVYRAHDIKDKSKSYAIKVLREEFFEDESFKKRFKNEAVIVDQLNHPNIVKVVERGEYGDGLYITMELLEGKTLYNILKEVGKLELEVALNIMTQIADAMVKIHEKNIIHRDLKPENIIIIQTEENAHFVKVLDFGLAKTQSLTRLTDTGVIVGTVFYQSPEQVTNRELTTASDIYVLGIVFYQMLSGQLPFFSESAVDVAKQILEKDPIEPVTFNKDISQDLNQLIIKMFFKNPTLRPTAKTILSTLKNIMDPDSKKTN